MTVLLIRCLLKAGRGRPKSVLDVMESDKVRAMTIIMLLSFYVKHAHLTRQSQARDL